MQELRERTRLIVERMFPENQCEEVRQFLVQECGSNLPFFDGADCLRLERVRFSVLKLSSGDIDKLLHAIDLAQRDWRDVFMAADFGYDVQEHRKWAERYLSGDGESGQE